MDKINEFKDYWNKNYSFISMELSDFQIKEYTDKYDIKWLLILLLIIV